MDEIRRLNLTLRLSQPEHQEAWEVLSTIPPRQRVHFICHVICEAQTRQNWLNTIQETIRAELKQFNTTSPSNQQEAEPVDQDVLGLLCSLWEGGDST